MNKKVILLALTLVLLLCPNGLLLVLTQVNNPYELTIVTIDFPETVDPSWSYDTASGELIMNVYDTLIRFDGESTDEFVPGLATDWTISEDGLTYTFTIRQFARWHDPAYGALTPKDVEYSFERWMVQDRSGGPTWMILKPLFDVHGVEELGDLTDPTEVATVGQMIDDAVESDATTVTLHLTIPYAPFLTIIAQPWAGILSEAWCTDYGDFPGFDDTGYDGWIAYCDPDVSPLDDYPVGTGGVVMMGTGPYMLDYWEKGIEWSIVMFGEYWGDWPARHPNWGTARGYLVKVTEKFIEEWATRKLLFLAGDADFCHVPRMYVWDVLGPPEIRCVYPLPTFSVDALFFNFNISTTSPYMGVPEGLPYGTIDESGIPPDFFSDIFVRRAFAYSFDYQSFIEDIWVREAVQLATPIPPDTFGHNPLIEGYEFNLDKAAEQFSSAWGGELWTNGFTMTICCDQGNIEMRMACEILEINIEALNPQFHINIVEVNTAPSELPIYFTRSFSGSDPHDWIFPFMHSEGYFSRWQGYHNSVVDVLIEEGEMETDPEIREDIYYELQAIYVDEIPSVPLCYPSGRHWEQTLVQGWYYNPILPGFYFYHLWKENIPTADIDSDSDVDIFDIMYMVMAFGSYYAPPEIHPDWDSRADLKPDGVVDIFDIVMIAKVFGYAALPWTPP